MVRSMFMSTLTIRLLFQVFLCVEWIRTHYHLLISNRTIIVFIQAILIFILFVLVFIQPILILFILSAMIDLILFFMIDLIQTAMTDFILVIIMIWHLSHYSGYVSMKVKSNYLSN